MGCFEEDADLVHAQLFCQGLIAAGTVRVEHVAVGLIAGFHGLADAFVRIGGSADILADGFPAVAVEIEDAGEVAWRTHVHGVGKGLLAGHGVVFAGLQVVEEHVVGIVGCDEMAHGQSHAGAEQSGGDVAEVAAGHADDEVGADGIAVVDGQRAHALELGIGVEVVERLRQEAGHVDGVGRREHFLLIEFLVHERVLDQRLAVIKDTVHF